MKICQLIGNAPRIKIEREPQQKSASDKISQYGKSESPLPVLGDSSDSQEEKPAVNPGTSILSAQEGSQSLFVSAFAQNESLHYFIAELPNGTGPPNLCRKTLQNSVDDSVRAGRLPPLHCTNVAGILCDLDFPTGPTSLSWLKASQNQLLFALGYPSGSGLIIVQEICLAIVADTVIYQVKYFKCLFAVLRADNYFSAYCFILVPTLFVSKKHGKYGAVKNPHYE